MELEKLVMAQLEKRELNGVKVINLLWVAETAIVTFEVGDVQIDFTAQNETDLQVTALRHHDQVYTDEASLSQCNDWSKYVLSVVYPLIKKQQSELAERVKEVKVDEPTQDAPAPTSIVASDEEMTLANRIKETEVIKEAEAKGHKEGFKAARRMNIQEIKKLKTKYQRIFIIILLLGVFLIFIYLYGFDMLGI